MKTDIVMFTRPRKRNAFVPGIRVAGNLNLLGSAALPLPAQPQIKIEMAVKLNVFRAIKWVADNLDSLALLPCPCLLSHTLK
jgi:hypothetical protein